MELRIQLKVCEGCGCLWYRAQLETRVYCAQCVERFKDFPAAKASRRKGRPRKITLPTVFAVHDTSFYAAAPGISPVISPVSIPAGTREAGAR